MTKTFEFPYRVENETFVIPTFGIFMLGCISTAICLFPVVATMDDSISGETAGSLGLGASGIGGALAAFLWIQLLLRLKRERKVVASRSGIAVHVWANKVIEFPWDGITVVEEELTDREGPSYTLTFEGGGKKQKILNDNYPGFPELVAVCAARVPERTTTVSPPMVSPEIRTAVSSWQ